MITTGRSRIKEGIYLQSGAKFCPENLDLLMVSYSDSGRDYWCIKDWRGWGDTYGSGSCDFDGECYY